MYKRDASGDTPLALSQRRGAPLRHLTAEEIELLEFTEASKEDIAVEPGTRTNLIFNKINRFLGPTCPSMSFADGPGLSREPIHANVRYSFTVFASDSERRLRSEGNDKLKVSIRGVSQPIGITQKNSKCVLSKEKILKRVWENEWRRRWSCKAPKTALIQSPTNSQKKVPMKST